MISAPKAPDPYATAAAQGGINKDTAIAQTGLNAMNQYTPEGSLEYSQGGTWPDGTPRFSVTQTLDPGSQKIADQNKHASWAISQLGDQKAWEMKDLLSKPFDMSQGAIDGQTAGMPALPSYRTGGTPGPQASSWSADPAFASQIGGGLARMGEAAGATGTVAPTANDFSTRYTTAPDQVQSRYVDAPGQVQSRYTTAPSEVQRRYDPDPEKVGIRQIGSNGELEGQLYDAAFARYQPQLGRQQQDLETSLANKGIKPGSTAYADAMQGYDNSVNDLRTQTFLKGQDQAFGQSKARAENDFGQDLASNNQFFTQWDTKNQHDFAQDFQATQARFQNELAANGQNFDQDLAGSSKDFDQRAAAAQQNFGQDVTATGQRFQQELGANGANFGQDATRSKQLFDQALGGAQFTEQQRNDLFTRLSALTTANLGAQGQDYEQRQAGQQNAFNQDMAQAQYGSAQDQYNFQAATSQRQQALNELLQNRSQPIDEVSALMGGSQVAKPSWTATPSSTIQPANLEGLVQSNYAAKSQQYAGMLGGLASLGGTAAKFAFSDERLKEDVQKVGEDPDTGLGIYKYRYKEGTGLGGGLMQLGVMAQEVEKKNPGAVATHKSGFKMVNYDKALAGGSDR